MDSSHMIRCKACDATVDTSCANNNGSATCPECGVTFSIFSDKTVPPGGASISVVSDDEELALLRIPGYEITSQIGKGGMGYVFEARQQSLDRPVAIKVLAPQLGNDPQFAARFEAEAAALARLAHPNIVSIYERGRCNDRLYFVMEFVAGDDQGRPVDLKNVISRGPLDNEHSRRIVVQVMRALTVAHAEGIVHRDIKPGNILLDRHGNAKVADFGIACFGDSPERQRFTQPSSAMGTYDYMAPEQRTDAASSDARADVYSTATMLYEMLTGRVPAGAFLPPSKARPGAHSSWDAVIARGMHPLREERFPNMTAFLKAVEELSFDVSFRSQDDHSTVAASPFVNCHDCEQPVHKDVKFCPSCRSPQFLNCAECGAHMRAAFNGCEKCGADLRNQRRLERFLGLGKVALDRARVSEEVADRIQAAQEAGIAFARARKLVDNDLVIAPLHAEANRIVEVLAAQAASNAIREKRFGEALPMLDAVLEVSPGRNDFERVRTKLTTERNQAITEAERLRNVGRPADAVRILAVLAKRFAGDESIGKLLQECQLRVTGLKTVVNDTMPTLIAEKKWCAVESLLRQLHSEKAQVSGLEDLTVRADTILASANSAIAQAETALTSGNYPLVVRWTDVILEKVTDHPRAIELRNAAVAVLDGLRDATGRLKLNLDQGRWFAVLHISRDISTEVRSFSNIAAMLRRANAGIEQSDRYLGLVIATVSGIAAMLAAVFIGGGMQEGLINSLRSFEAGSALFGYRWVAALTLLGVPVGVGLAWVILIAIALRRPVAKGMMVIAALVVPLFCLGALFFANSNQWAQELIQPIAKFGSLSPIGFLDINSIKAGAANATLWTGYALAIATCVSGMRGPSGASLCKAAIFAGCAATLAAIYSLNDNFSPPSGLNSAILIAAITVFIGRTSSNVYFISIIFAGLMTGGCVNMLESQMKWLAPVLAVPAMFAAQAVLAKPQTILAWLTDFAIIVIAVFGAPYLQHPFLRIGTMISIAPDAIIIVWFLVAASLAKRWEFLKEIDRRFHLYDRFTTRQWAVWPASSPK